MKNLAQGGKAVFGAELGILMLEARFPRIKGDIGNALTWPFPVHYKVVKGASPDLVVRNRGEGLLDAFLEGAQELVNMGVDGIITNCGFLALFQNEISAATRLPVATSSLMQYDVIKTLLPPNKTVGIITISAESLSEDHLLAANIPLSAPIVGTDQGGKEFSRVILDGGEHLDVRLAEQDMLDAAHKLLDMNPEVGAILLECTNMCPYSASIRAATQLPVFDMYNFICWFQNALSPPKFLNSY